jgi:thioredoxin 1
MDMAGRHVHEFNDGNFETEVVSSDLPVLVDFWASWCAPCRAIAPIVDELASDYAGKLKVGKVDVDNNHGVASTYRITSIPAVYLFKNGEVVEQLVGARPKAHFVQAIAKHL